MKLPFSDEEYKKKKESHEILVPGDLCYCKGPYNPLDGWMVVIEGNYMDLYSNLYPCNSVADIYQLNQYAGFSYHDDFKNDREVMIVEEGAWYYRHDLIYIRHLNKTEYGTIKALAEAGAEVPKEIADAIFKVKREYLDKYIDQTEGLTRVNFIDVDNHTTIGMILEKLPGNMKIHIDNIHSENVQTLQRYINYIVDPNTMYIENTKDGRTLLHLQFTREIRHDKPSHDDDKPKQILDIHEITPIATIKRPKKIKLKKIESKVKKEEPEESKKTIRPLYGPGDLVHLKDDDKHDLYIVLGSEAYRCSSVGFVYPNIRYPSFHTYFVMNTNTHICSYTVYSNMVLYEQHFSQIALKEYYNRFLEEKI